MKNLSVIAATALLSFLMISDSGCTKNSATVSVGPILQVQIQTNAASGNYLVDKNLNTLYFYALDANGQSNCSGGCETNWPILNDSNLTAANLGPGLNLSDFSSIQTPEGMQQLTYKGWPLYNFAPGGIQEPTGQITGDGGGGTFFLAKPNYTIMIGIDQLVGADGNNYTSTYTLGTGPTTYLTDARGATLYTFSVDSANENKFTKSDFSNNTTFPIYDTTSIVVPSILNAALFGTISVFGENQMTYNGWPLYYYGADMGLRGSTKGITIGALKKWPVATPTTTAAP